MSQEFVFTQQNGLSLADSAFRFIVQVTSVYTNIYLFNDLMNLIQILFLRLIPPEVYCSSF